MKSPRRKPRRDRQQEKRLERARNIEMFIRTAREEMTTMLADLEIIVDELRGK
jgi:hypothetical protein